MLAPLLLKADYRFGIVVNFTSKGGALLARLQLSPLYGKTICFD
jgi:hypothetical protein